MKSFPKKMEQSQMTIAKLMMSHCRRYRLNSDVDEELNTERIAEIAKDALDLFEENLPSAVKIGETRTKY